MTTSIDTPTPPSSILVAPAPPPPPLMPPPPPPDSPAPVSPPAASPVPAPAAPVFYTVAAPVAPPPAPLPYSLVIIGITADSTNAPNTTIDTTAWQTVTCPAGTTLTFAAQLQTAAGAVAPVTTTFHMPAHKRNGGEGVFLATATNGAVSVVAPFTVPGDDGVWTVTQAMINSGLPASQQMQFAGVTITVYRAPPVAAPATTPTPTNTPATPTTTPTPTPTTGH